MHAVVAGALESYEAAAVAAPLLTKSATSLAGFAIADVVAQSLSGVRPPLSPHPLVTLGVARCRAYGWQSADTPVSLFVVHVNSTLDSKHGRQGRSSQRQIAFMGG